jgi:hypothetical protein
MVNVDDRLFFVMNDTLWQSDGSRQGTHKIKDETIDGVRGINGLAAAHGKIYFYGYTYATGQELYAADIASPFVSSQPVASNSSGSPRTNVFAAQLLTNPVKDVLKFTVSVKGEQYTQIVISDVAGRTLVSDKKILSSGINIFTYNANGWARGIYLIRIATADGSSSLLKAAK